jgi:exonuclease SbcD
VVDLMRIPKTGAAPLPLVLKRLADLPSVDEYLDEDTRPYLEVAVKLNDPEPALRAKIAEALVGRAPKLVKLSVVRPGRTRALADSVPVATLHDLTPEQVFRSLYRKVREGATRTGSEPESEPKTEPPPELLEVFHELVDAVAQHEEGGVG